MANNYCKTNIQYVSDAQKRVEKKNLYTTLSAHFESSQHISHFMFGKKMHK